MYVKLEETISSRITANYFCIKLGYKLKVTHEVEKWKRKLFSHVPLFVTPQTAAHQAPLSMGFSRQAYWSGLPSLL